MAANSPPADALQAELHQAIRERLERAERVLVTAHVRPDGDAVGSVLGLGLALAAAGKTVRMALVDGVPPNLQHLEGSRQVKRGAGDLASFDTLVALDSADLQRTGGILGERAPDINIDHHVTNTMYGALNLVLTGQVATAAILAKYLPTWGLGYNKAVAEALLTGIVTDTLGFRTSNITPEALHLAAMLMEHGAYLPTLYTRALVSKTFEAARYWSYGLGRLQQERAPAGGVLTWTALTLADRLAAGYPGNDDADLVNMLSAVDGDVTVIFVEQKDGVVKVSWRARPGIDVSRTALPFCGGGHPAAAGAQLSGSLDEVQAVVLAATRALFTGQTAEAASGDQA
jgi:bifunctional oligoribonuclease and PAP phosphatase NrnA